MARAAEQAYLQAALAKRPPPVSEEPVSFVPSGYDAPDPPAAEPSAMPARLQAAVRRLSMAQRLGAPAGRHPRRYGDPRDHLTTRGAGGRGGGGDDDDAGVFRRKQHAPGGELADEVATTRHAFAAAQELARQLRLGTAGAVADLSGVPFGAGGARLLGFVLPKARALRELRLSGTALGDAGAASLAHALRAMTTTRHVDLRHCRIGAAGGAALADALDVGCDCLLYTSPSPRDS